MTQPSKEVMELDMLVAELDYENRLLRARNERLQKELESAQSMAPVQEPVIWKWFDAPVKTQWGDDVVVSDLAIDKDHTASVYCERDQIAKVEAMFTPPSVATPLAAALKPLTDEEIHAIYDEVAKQEPYMGAVTRRNVVRAIEAAHGITGETK